MSVQRVPTFWLLWALVVTFTAGGCSPRNAYPPNWVVEAEHPHGLARWNARHLPHMPADLQQSYSLALLRISDGLGRPRPRPGNEFSRDAFDPLCRRIHGRTVRQVVLDGFDSRLETLTNKLALESRNLTANLSRAEGAQNFDKFIAFQRSVIERYELEKVRVAEARKQFEQAYP